MVVSFPQELSGQLQPYGVCNHLRELLEAELAVSVPASFRDNVIHDSLQLHVLPTQIISSRESRHSYAGMNEP